MPLGPGVRYRRKGDIRLAFRGNHVVETKNMKTGAMHQFLSKQIESGKLKKGKKKSRKY